MKTSRSSLRQTEEISVADAVLDISWSQSIGLAILLTIAMVFGYTAAQKAGSLLFATSCAAAVIALAGAAVLREKLLVIAVGQGVFVWLAFGGTMLWSPEKAPPITSSSGIDRGLAQLGELVDGIPYLSTTILVVAAFAALAAMGARAVGRFRK